MKDFAGKTAVVPGAGSGIGRAAALAFAAEGMAVAVADLREDRAAAVAAEIAAAGGQGLAVPCDVANDDDLQRLGDRTIDRFGRIDLVMNNVGIIFSVCTAVTKPATGTPAIAERGGVKSGQWVG